MKRNSWSNQCRFEGTGSLICMSLAVFLSVSSVTVAAQTVFDFQDPLDDVRAKIEQSAAEKAAPAPSESVPTPAATDSEATPSSADSDATPSAAVSASAADERPVIKGPATAIAERLGLPTAGLFGLGALAILALLLGLMWLLGRRKASKNVKRKDRELYAVADGSRARRSLESGAKVSRHRAEALDTSEPKASDVIAPTAASAAARILSDEAPDSVVTETYGAAPKAEAKPIATVETNPNDPDTWKRPNLDRLKDSIRDDWKGSKAEESAAEQVAAAEAEAEVSTMRAEADNFASLFGDDADSTAHQTAAKSSPVLDMLGDYETDQDTMSVADLRAAVDNSAKSSAETDSVTHTDFASRSSDSTSRNDALRRIRALRESVQAG